jgi:hypothetical protein
MPQGLRVSHLGRSAWPQGAGLFGPMPQGLLVSHGAGAPGPKVQDYSVPCRKVCTSPIWAGLSGPNGAGFGRVQA